MTLHRCLHILTSKVFFNRVITAVIVTYVLLVSSLNWAVAQPAYITGTWSDQRIHFLDSNLNNISSFAANADSPNGTAFDGTLIYSGHFSTSQVIAYNMSGVEQFRWSAPISNLQGMEMVGSALAIFNEGSPQTVQYRNPFTGALINTIPGQSSIEGLAYDGSILWQLDDSVIYATNPATGAVIRTIPNPGVNAAFGGTGLAANAVNQLTVAAQDGAWWKISSVNGALLASGNNGLNMYALTSLTFVPEPTAGFMMSLAGMFAMARHVMGRRRTRIGT